MSQYRIAFLDRSTLGPGVDLRKPSFDHHWAEYEQTSADQVLDRLQNVDIAIINKVPVCAALLKQLPNLKFVAVAATGTNTIDLNACREQGILVSNIQGYATVTVPEHTFAMILGLRRNLFQYRSEVIAGVWQESKQYCYFNRPIHDLANTTLGIIGTGAIAMAVGRLAEAFSMKVIYHSLSGRVVDGNRSCVSLDKLLQQADIVSLHCPLTEKSQGLINRVSFEKMKPDSLLINTARGEIVDLDDLQWAMESGRIAGAAIDVSPIEPPPNDSPLMVLAARSNFLLTPHIAWASVEAMQVLADQVIDNIEAFVAGHPQHIVN